jgi:FeS assembly SUF system regulator
MLRISKLTDYAVVLATHLAGSDDAHSVRDLAFETRIPSPTVSKVLKALVRGGVVASQRGAHGGYRLARRPEDIAVLEVIAALEGPVAVTECTDDTTDSNCEHEARGGVRANWHRINQAVQSALSAIRLSDMTSATPLPLVSIARSRDEAARLREESL